MKTISLLSKPSRAVAAAIPCHRRSPVSLVILTLNLLSREALMPESPPWAAVLLSGLGPLDRSIHQMDETVMAAPAAARAVSLGAGGTTVEDNIHP
ncbi:hypothetical protein RRG08_001645 [Elysia crispata]|uniref:Uncharacterized protein n=1 Tax=Elysia crispata TaxID=231223 RepID=A0AAE1E0P1_9GAST|nr:hypothetical protein RRG08_001645 [Elysia crispata]